MRKSASLKPNKPYPEFPLFAHNNGQWAKKIRGRHRFFGTWDDWKAASDRYERERDALYAGRDPRGAGDSLSVNDGVNTFLTAKLSLVQSGAIKQRSYDDYEHTCRDVIKAFGRTRSIASLVPSDFDDLRKTLAKRFGPVRLTSEVTRVRVLFKYLHDACYIEHPVRFGPHFKKPSAMQLRLARAESGNKLVSPYELQTLLANANNTLKAMIYLGINCGLGNADIGNLHYSHLDMRGGWLVFPRPKTGIQRKAKLWPETIKALIAVPHRTPVNPADKVCVFLTYFGRPWTSSSRDTPVAKEFCKLVKSCKLERDGLSFYSLRHTFQTIAEEAKDHPAVRYVMGHVPSASDMSSVYRQAMSDERLKAVADHVRKWSKTTKRVSLRVS